MSELISTVHLSQNRVSVLSGKLPEEANRLQSFREVGNPEVMITKMFNKHRKRKNQKPELKEMNRKKKFKPLAQNQSQSLDDALKGKPLRFDQGVKKDLLETVVPISSRNGEMMSLSQYLHENGFTYESQLSMVSFKKVEKYMINYLVALFFQESENPLIEDNLDKNVLKRISNKWRVLKDVLKEVGMEIRPEQAALNLLKNFGCAYESLIIFLDLFESDASMLETSGIKERWYPKYEDLNYPASKLQFLKDVLEIAKGASVSLKGFLMTFQLSEWEGMARCLWEEIFDVTQTQHFLNDYLLKYDGDEWRIVSDNGLGQAVRRLDLVNLNNPEIKDVILLDNESGKILFLEKGVCFDRATECGILVRDAGVSEAVLLHHFITCVKATGGMKNKSAFMDCMMIKSFDLEGEKKTLYHFLKSEKGGGLSALESLQVLSKCIGTEGGGKNKQAFLECLMNPEIDLDGKKVSLYQFFISQKGGRLSNSEAIHLMVRVVGNHGGVSIKNAFVDCLSNVDIVVCGEKLSLYGVLISKQGGRMSPIDAIYLLARCMGRDGGVVNKQSLKDCFIKPEINLNGEKQTLFNFLSSKEGGGLSVFDTIHAIARCTCNEGSLKNKQVLIECFTKSEICFDGETMSLFRFLCLETGGNLSIREAIQYIVKCIGHHGGDKNKKVLIECLIKPEIYLNGENVSLYTFLCSNDRCGLSQLETLGVISQYISKQGGAKNKKALIAEFTKPENFSNEKSVAMPDLNNEDIGFTSSQLLDSFYDFWKEGFQFEFENYQW